MNIDDLKKILESGTKAELEAYAKENNLSIGDGVVKHRDPKKVKSEIDFWDKRQHIKKILLNSLYGAILNNGSRFNDDRIGQSTTLTGRSITKHMTATINLAIANVYDHTGQAIIYGDTDSGFFSAYPLMKDDIESGKIRWEREDIIKLYNCIADVVNESFPDYMRRGHNVQGAAGEIIKGNRETVSSSGIFITKKRYGVLMYDKDGKRLDKNNKPGKLKAMGMDLRRSDTPKNVQQFLSTILMDILTGAQQKEVMDKVIEFKHEFKKLDPWMKGTPKRVNNLKHYTKLEDKNPNSNLPGHVRAAYNWNKLRKMYGDSHSMEIMDGMKTIVCSIFPNPTGMTTVGYPTDEERLPEWFKKLPFDENDMEDTIVTKKVYNLVNVLGWDVVNETNIQSTYNSLFSDDD